MMLGLHWKVVMLDGAQQMLCLTYRHQKSGDNAIHEKFEHLEILSPVLGPSVVT